MRRAPDVSVVISSFNRCDQLRVAVRALLDQQIPDDLVYEVIVVDNNSTDATPGVLEELTRTDRTGRLRTLHEPRQGVSYGRNAGIAAAAAPIIAFSDDDNVAAPNWIATLRDAFHQQPHVAAIGGRVLPMWPDSVPEWVDRRHWSPLALLDLGIGPVTTNAAYPQCMLTANLTVRRHVLEEIGGFSPDFPRCQDHELMLRLWRAGYDVVYLPALVVYASVPPERLTRGYHRRWHRMHGKFASAMRLQEIIDRTGRLVTPADTPRLLGTPGFVLRDFIRHVTAWTKSVLTMRMSEARFHAHRVEYFAAYIRENASRTITRERVKVIPDVATFLGRSLVHGSRRVGLSLPRLAMVHAMLAALVLGSAYDIYTGREHWPLSPYPMFSQVVREPTLHGLRLMGVPESADAAEVPILDYGMLEPLDQRRVETALARTVNNVSRRHLVAEMLRDRLFHYERHRLAGNHDGPPLKALRLYETFWTLQPDAGNVDRPDKTTLVHEVTHADLHRSARTTLP